MAAGRRQLIWATTHLLTRRNSCAGLSGRLTATAEVIQNGFRLRACNHCRQCRSVCLFHRLDAAKVLQQATRCILPDSWYLGEFGSAITHLPTLAVKSDCEAVGFVP